MKPASAERHMSGSYLVTRVTMCKQLSNYSVSPIIQALISSSYLSQIRVPSSTHGWLASQDIGVPFAIESYLLRYT